jgi:hypothetical protein
MRKVLKLLVLYLMLVAPPLQGYAAATTRCIGLDHHKTTSSAGSFAENTPIASLVHHDKDSVTSAADGAGTHHDQSCKHAAACCSGVPMMTGEGPFGSIEMGGMFTVIKIREGLARNDYKDPGWYEHPAGTVAFELEAEHLRPRGTAEQRLSEA